MKPDSEKSDSTKLLIWCMKYLPFIGTVFVTAHCALLLNGVNLPISEALVGFPISSMLMFFVLSKQFNFCALHKHLIGYVSAMEICMFFQKCNVWGRFLTPARWVMMGMGCVLIVWSIIVFARKKPCGCY